MRTSTSMLAIALSMAACGDPAGTSAPDDGTENATAEDAGEPQEDATLAHTLRLESIGEQGGLRLTLEPDGSAEGQLGPAEPFTFTVEDEQMDAIATAVAAAALPGQPEEITSDPDITDQVVTDLEYGDAHVEARGPDTPAEISDLRVLLEQVVLDNEPER